MSAGEREHPDSAWFARLSQELMVDQDVQATMDRVVARVGDVVPAADFAALTVRQRRGRLRTLAHTDDIALLCDKLQYECKEGPCVDSAVDDEPHLVRSTGEDPRWPTWGPEVAELGVHSLVSVQLPATVIDPGRDPLGAINLYARQPDAFDEVDLSVALVFAVHAANAITMAHLVTTLGDAVEARHQVGLAQGVLIHRYGIDADQAFDSLQRYSNHSNVKLRDVAATVVAERGLPGSYEELVAEATAVVDPAD